MESNAYLSMIKMSKRVQHACMSDLGVFVTHRARVKAPRDLMGLLIFVNTCCFWERRNTQMKISTKSSLMAMEEVIMLLLVKTTHTITSISRMTISERRWISFPSSLKSLCLQRVALIVKWMLLIMNTEWGLVARWGHWFKSRKITWPYLDPLWIDSLPETWKHWKTYEKQLAFLQPGWGIPFYR